MHRHSAAGMPLQFVSSHEDHSPTNKTPYEQIDDGVAQILLPTILVAGCCVNLDLDLRIRTMTTQRCLILESTWSAASME